MSKWKEILTAVVLGTLVAVASSFGFALLGQINARVRPDLPWAAFAILAIGVAVGLMYGRSVPRSGNSRPRAPWIYIAISAGLGFLGLALIVTAQGSLISVTLPGDNLPLSPTVQHVTSIAVFVGAAFAEEAAFRGRIQLRVQHLLGMPTAEAVAGSAFVLAHLGRFEQWEEIVFVASVAVCAGRVASWSQTTLWPIVVHCLANLTILAAVLISR